MLSGRFVCSSRWSMQRNTALSKYLEVAMVETDVSSLSWASGFGLLIGDAFFLFGLFTYVAAAAGSTQVTYIEASNLKPLELKSDWF